MEQHGGEAVRRAQQLTAMASWHPHCYQRAAAYAEAWGRSEPGNVPPGFVEHVQHAFHLRLDRLPPDEEWQWQEKSGGEVVEHRFAFRWASLEEAATVLWPHQAMWIESVRTSLSHP